MVFVKAKKKAVEDRLLSTLDIIDKKEIDSDLCAKIVRTGDMLLYGHNFENPNPMTRWYRVIVAGGGKAQMERRLPILHVGTIIKDPPSHIKTLYKIKPEDGSVFVFDSTSMHPQGARLTPLAAWLKMELLSSSDKVLLRTRKQNVKLDPPEELWEWLEAASTIRYQALSSEVLFNGLFIEGALVATINVVSNIIMDEVEDRLGDNPIARLIQGAIGLVTQFLVLFVWLLFIFVPTLLFSYIPFVLKGGLKSGKSAKLNKNDMSTMFCSKTAAETLMHMGVLSTQNSSSHYMPKDFLPKDIGATGNQLDDNLNGSFKYSDRLSNVFLTREPEAPPAKATLRHSIMARITASTYESDAHAYLRKSYE